MAENAIPRRQYTMEFKVEAVRLTTKDVHDRQGSQAGMLPDRLRHSRSTSTMFRQLPLLPIDGRMPYRVSVLLLESPYRCVFCGASYGGDSRSPVRAGSMWPKHCIGLYAVVLRAGPGIAKERGSFGGRGYYLIIQKDYPKTSLRHIWIRLK
ncbi:hypothetical protein [Burkholderia sp. MSMB1078WGS]|uniref:hypothetical protein n=1 Tax=Burkholderia sp. MSMB1078WGS TaxID=1637900 RepID=UPI000A566CB8|nr:hypothetical protein [Burkholderia sp. MSMB1078WGS]